jgi:hypothetical protein
VTDTLADAVKQANIIGLPVGPWDVNDWYDWPTEGYDGPLAKSDWEGVDARPDDPFAMSGYTREEWLALGDEMIARWTAWRDYIASLPAEGK